MYYLSFSIRISTVIYVIEYLQWCGSSCLYKTTHSLVGSSDTIFKKKNLFAYCYFTMLCFCCAGKWISYTYTHISSFLFWATFYLHVSSTYYCLFCPLETWRIKVHNRYSVDICWVIEIISELFVMCSCIAFII